MKVYLYKPKINELSFRQELLQDEDTMSYNKAWGGTIDFPKEKWKGWYTRWVINKDNKRYYRFLKNEDGDFIGEIALHYDSSYDGYMVNVIIHTKCRRRGYGLLALKKLCAVAKKRAITVLYDDIAIDNSGISIFLKCGFQEVSRTDKIILLKRIL